MKRKNSARANQPRNGAQRGEGIGKKLDNETTHSCIERFFFSDLGNIGFGEAHIGQARLTHASSSSDDGLGIALYTHDLSRGSNQPSDQQIGYLTFGRARLNS